MFLNKTIRKKAFKILKIIPQFKNVDVKQKRRVIREMVVRQKAILHG